MGKIVYNAIRDRRVEQGSAEDHHYQTLDSNSKLEQFHLSVIRPIKGKPGELVYEMIIVDHTISAAVAHAQTLIGKEGGLIVLQTASVIRDHVVDPSQRDALLKKLGIYQPEGYDMAKAKMDYRDREAKLDGLSAPKGWAVIDAGIDK